MSSQGRVSRKVVKTCVICGIEYEVYKAHEGRYVTCGKRECRSLYSIRQRGGTGTAVSKICPICGETFQVRPSNAARWVTCRKPECKRAYHRKRLREKWGLPEKWQGDRSPLLEKKCVICGRPYRIPIRYQNAYKTCGDPECVSKQRSLQSGFRKKGQRPSEKLLAEALTPYPNWIPEYRVHTGERNPDGTFTTGVANYYRLDFGNPVDKVYVEIDGSSHNRESARRRDARKDEYMQSLGWKVIRIPEQEVLENLEEVVGRIIAMSPTPYQGRLFDDV